MTLKPPIHGRDHAPGGADPLTWMTAGGGIQFETRPQAGEWLYVETTADTEPTDGWGIQFKTTDGVLIRQEGHAATLPALKVENMLDGLDEMTGLAVEVESDSATAGSSVLGIDVSAFSENESATAIAAAATSDETGGTGDVVGVTATARIRNDADNATGVYGQADVFSSSAAGNLGIGVHGAAFKSATATGFDKTIGGVFQGGTGAAPETQASVYTGIVARARSGSEECTGLVVDVDSTSGTEYLIRGWIGSTKILEITANGDIHIPTGRSVIADL